MKISIVLTNYNERNTCTSKMMREHREKEEPKENSRHGVQRRWFRRASGCVAMLLRVAH